jgi:hypothetical protein
MALKIAINDTNQKNLNKMTYGRDAFTISILKNAVESLKL